MAEDDAIALEQELALFTNLVHLVSGFYAWEVVVQLFAFDWSIISGKRHFRWPMVMYLACRYFMLFALAGALVLMDTKRQLNCQALFAFTQFAGNTCIGFASSLLMLRTIAVWNRETWITIPVVIINLGQWAILLHGTTNVVAAWSPQASSCVIARTNRFFLDLMYFYTMCFDLLVLILTSWGLLRYGGRSNLWKLLFTDGVIFFALAFISNVFPAVFITLNLSPAMNMMFSILAAVIATTISCRSFIRLATYSHPNAFHGSDAVSTNIRSSKTPGDILTNNSTDVLSSSAVLPFYSTAGGGICGPSSGVHVIVETFSNIVEDGRSQDGVFDKTQHTQAWEDKTGDNAIII